MLSRGQYKVIPTRDYSSRNGRRIIAGVIHTAEGALDEVSLGKYFASTSQDVSSHWGIGQQGGIALYVPEKWAAWTARSANSFAVQVELCGFAKWTRAQWLAKPKMLDSCARLMAEWHQDYGFALRHGTVAELRQGVKAFYDHDDCSKAFDGTHWDVGNGFPWDIVLAKAKRYAYPVITPTPPKENDPMAGDLKKYPDFKTWYSPWGGAVQSLIHWFTQVKSREDASVEARLKALESKVNAPTS